MTIVLFLMAIFAATLLCLLWREHNATVLRLEAENAELRKQNERLVETLTPALRRFDRTEAVKTAEDIVKAKHAMSRGERDAKCSCGWMVHADDPAVLQAEISTHYREHSPAIRGGRKSWPQILRAAEHRADELAEQEIVKGATK